MMDSILLIFPIIGGTIGIVVGVLFICAVRHARRPVKGEQVLAPLYCEQAGGPFDQIHWSIPFVSVATFQTSVSISCITREIVLNRGDVTAIEIERHLFSVALRLHHHRSDLPGILLWPRNTARLEATLRTSRAV